MVPLAAWAAFLVLLTPGLAGAGVTYAKDEALKLAFPDAEVRTHTVFLTPEQLAAVKERAGVDVDSKLFTYYEGRRDGELVGFAVIDTHIVRTLPETFLAVLSPDGVIARVIVLAFYEPPEYQPRPRWLAQFEHRALDGAPWRLGHDLHGISGATLTALAVRDGLRKILVLHDVVMRPRMAAH
jgi:hypothetical protein